MRKNRCSNAAAGLIAGALPFLAGCSHIPLLDPKGPIGDAERFVILVAIGLMLIVVVPVAIMTIAFPWRFRAANPRADYRPQWSRSRSIELVVWLVPAAIVTLLSILVWTSTHRLDPYKPITVDGAEPLQVQVVSLDWKWLFIYPDQNIATVNQLVFPAGVPLSFRLTSGTVMTSFFIPRLGSQIYAMAGMQTRLHLMADEPGTFRGQNQQFSGRGYAGMTFTATATSPEAFTAWVDKVRQSAEGLDPERYARLETPGEEPAAVHFSSVAPGLFESILHKYDPTHPIAGAAMAAVAGQRPTAAAERN